MQDAMASAETIHTWTEHMWETTELVKNLSTNLDKGLSAQKAQEKFATHGENALTEKAAVPWYCVFIKEQTGFFSLLLWFGSALCFLGFIIQEDKESDLSNLYLGIVLAFVVFVTGCFSYMQTSKAASLMADFKNFIPPSAMALRDGTWTNVEARYLVPGDIIKIGTGQNIPADVILVKATEMKVNNASLTGESEDLLRDVGIKTQNILESPNVAFFGTMCTAGQGEGIVFKTGDETVIGRIANLTTSAEKKETPLSIEIERFIKIISAVAMFLGVTFFIFGIIYGYDLITNLVFAIGIIVANVPEGLLATVTVSLALTAKRMAKKFVLVKNLESVETLGSTSCICSDKTGTLTQNRMTLSQVFYDRKVLDASLNFEIFFNREQRAREQGEEALKKLKVPEYYDNETKTFEDGFVTLAKCLALTTTSYFAYQPTNEDIRNRLAKQKNKNVKSIPKDVKAGDAWYQDFQTCEKELLAIEERTPYIKRRVEGDASETGLVKFVQPLLFKKFNGLDYNGLDGMRKTYPIHTYGDSNNEAMIPFSSAHKFNLIVRDMNTAVRNPTTAEDNLCVFMKGAPERIVARCSRILVRGVEQPLTESAKEDTQAANDRFGNMGERVLGFARCLLDPTIFTKDIPYEFDIKGWKMWGE